MSICLRAPKYKAGGPDGKGWNRLSLNAHMGMPLDQCALRPRSYPMLAEAWRDTRLARWGNYGRCTNGGDCNSCPLLTSPPRRSLNAFGDSVLVRVKLTRVGEMFTAEVVTEPWVMNRPEGGWGSYGKPWTWEELMNIKGWRIGRPYRDEHSDGFWLERVEAVAA